jgi:hypothetical protein
MRFSNQSLLSATPAPDLISNPELRMYVTVMGQRRGPPLVAPG